MIVNEWRVSVVDKRGRRGTHTTTTREQARKVARSFQERGFKAHLERHQVELIVAKAVTRWERTS